MTDKDIEQHGVSRRSLLKTAGIAGAIGVVGLPAATGSAAAGIGDGRVAHYTMNNLHGRGRDKDEVHDASPYGNDGHIIGDVSVASDMGQVGNAFTFDGAGDYIEVDHHGSLNVTTATAAAWLKFSEDARYHFFLSKRGADGDEYQMYYRGADFATPTMAFWDGTNIYDGALDLATDTWHHLAWVIDGDGFRGYHNGTEVLSIADAAMPPGTGSSPLFIGYDTVGNYAQGMFDEVRLYDRALSETEIQDLAAMGEE